MSIELRFESEDDVCFDIASLVNFSKNNFFSEKLNVSASTSSSTESFDVFSTKQIRIVKEMLNVSFIYI